MVVWCLYVHLLGRPHNITPEEQKMSLSTSFMKSHLYHSSHGYPHVTARFDVHFGM
jgi:hypothetical protein